MRKLLIGFVALAVIVGAGFAAFRLGWLDRRPSSAASGAAGRADRQPLTDDQRRELDEGGAQQFQNYASLARELRARPIDLDEALEKIGRDPATLAGWIQQHIAFEPYEGFMKGAQGTLVSGRANSADKALLLAELLHRAGVSVKLVRGTPAGAPQVKAALPEEPNTPPTDQQLNDTAARMGIDGAELRSGLTAVQVRHQKLLENLWTRVDRDVAAVGGALDAAHVRVPGAAGPAIPAERWWVRTDKGDLDPTFGQPGGSETSTHEIEELPSDQFHRMTIRVHIASGGGESTVLESSFRSADLFGQTVVVGNVPLDFGKNLANAGKATAQSVFAAAGAVTKLQPQIMAGGKTQAGEAFDLQGNKVAAGGGRSDAASGAGGGMGGLLGGLSGEEGEEQKKGEQAKTGTVSLTAAYVDIDLDGPGQAQAIHIRRDLLLPGSTGRQRILDLLATREILVLPDQVTPEYVDNLLLQYADAWRQWISAHKRDSFNPLNIREYQDMPHFEATLYAFGLLRRAELRHLSESRLGRITWAAPRPTVVSYVRRFVDANRPAVAAGIDILENTLLPLEGAAPDWRHHFAFAAGILDTALEHEVVSGPGVRSNTSVYLEQALRQGRRPMAVQVSLPSDLPVSAIAREQIQGQLGEAAVVVVPQTPSSWYRVNLTTGATLGYVEGGGGQELSEYAEKIAMDVELKGILEFWGNLFKCIAMGVEAPLGGYENNAESLVECFKLMCGSVPGAVGKVADAEGLIGGVLGYAADKFYEKLCEKLWEGLSGKKKAEGGEK
jgi:hypothetical protein